MEDSLAKNAGRFTGFAGLYDQARPVMPLYAVEIMERYLGRRPEKVVDLGCGTGLSTRAWLGHADDVTGIDPSDDMLAVAKGKKTAGIAFKKGSSSDTGMAASSVDVVVCSQSFHWMEPCSTLSEVNRILKPGGVFATVDCDWPPVCVWQVEKAYDDLLEKVRLIEETDSVVKATFVRWDKENHLHRLRQSGDFRYVREIVFSSREKCSRERFVELAKSQGGVQTLLKREATLINKELDRFEKTVHRYLAEGIFDVDFGYRMRIGVK